jgi:biopolymer transport protein ExbD
MAIKPRNKPSVEFSMASMTDIVFLLLIFFIITSTLISPNALKVLLPTSSAKTTSKKSISVTITPDLKYFVNQQEVNAESIEAVLKQQLANIDKPGIILHVDRTVPVEYAVKVMDIANRNGYEMVLATKPK